MSQGDSISIQGVLFKVVARKGSRVLIEWIDSIGGLKTRWIILK